MQLLQLSVGAMNKFNLIATLGKQFISFLEKFDGGADKSASIDSTQLLALGSQSDH
jgi:hypothetical protein